MQYSCDTNTFPSSVTEEEEKKKKRKASVFFYLFFAYVLTQELLLEKILQYIVLNTEHCKWVEIREQI